MTFPRPVESAIGTSWADRLLVAELGVLAFLLGCYELFDPDIWWHSRSGQWILEHGRVPFLDIFSFRSADRVWVDLHWGFPGGPGVGVRARGRRRDDPDGVAAEFRGFLIAMTARGPGWPRWAPRFAGFPRWP